jgi:formate dehydrogenase assembly factor FdhD
MSTSENAISNMLGDGFEVEDKDGKTWRVGLIDIGVLSDTEQYIDQQRKNRAHAWAKGAGLSRQDLAAYLAAQDKTVITTEDVFEYMASITGMQYVVWRCLSTHHAGLKRNDAWHMFTDEQREALVQRLLKDSGLAPEGEDENPTTKQTESPGTSQ